MVQLALLMRDRGSPHIVTYYGAWQDDDNVYVVMEHCSKCDGERGAVSDLYTAVSTGVLPWTGTHRVEATKQMLAGIESLHCKGVALPNLRLENFLVSSTGSIKLACLIPTSCASLLTPPGSKSRSAEDLMKVDIFKLGCVLTNLMNHHSSSSTAQLPSVPEASVQDFIARLVHPDPAQRPNIRTALKHPWLNPDREAVTDCIVGTATNYSWEASLALGGQ